MTTTTKEFQTKIISSSSSKWISFFFVFQTCFFNGKKEWNFIWLGGSNVSPAGVLTTFFEFFAPFLVLKWMHSKIFYCQLCWKCFWKLYLKNSAHFTYKIEEIRFLFAFTILTFFFHIHNINSIALTDINRERKRIKK